MGKITRITYFGDRTGDHEDGIIFFDLVTDRKNFPLWARRIQSKSKRGKVEWKDGRSWETNRGGGILKRSLTLKGNSTTTKGGKKSRSRTKNCDNPASCGRVEALSSTCNKGTVRHEGRWELANERVGSRPINTGKSSDRESGARVTKRKGGESGRQRAVQARRYGPVWAR